MNNDNELEGGISALFAPKSVAIVGASADEAKFGGRVMRNILRYGFEGAIFPVNARGEPILGVEGYAKLSDVPAPVDLAVIAVPKAIVNEILDQCGDRGVKAAIIVSSGFAEAGGEGENEQRDLLDCARRNGIRLLGPNSLGVYHAGGKLAAAASQVFDQILEPGNIALLSQSGALGGSLLDAGMDQGLRFSSFVSVGNGADLEVPDLLFSQIDDPTCKVILLYIEGIRDLRKLADGLTEARRRGKRVIVLRAGWSDRAAMAIHSHTGSLAGSKAAYTALFRRHRVIQVDDMQEALDAARIASYERDVGKRIGFVSVSGGMGSLAADRCADLGLEVATFEEETRSRLKAALPSFAPNDNPLDVTGAITSTPGLMGKVLRIVSEDTQTDVIVVLITVVFGSERIAEEIIETRDGIGKPLVVVVSGGASLKSAVSRLKESGVLVFRQLQPALLALARVARTSDGGRGANPDAAPGGFFDGAAREAIFRAVSAAETGNEGATLLTEHESKAILRAAGVPVCTEAVVATPERAVEQAQAFGFPVVLKGLTSEIGHKAKAGLVKLNICNEDQVARSFREIETAAQSVHGKLDGVLVQPMLPPGIELLIGAMRDPQAGPLVAFGLGGVFTESLNQITFRPAPISEDEAFEMIWEVPTCARLLEGKPERFKPLTDVLVRVANLIADVAAIEELDINPFIYYPGESRGAAVDGLIRCAKS